MNSKNFEDLSSALAVVAITALLLFGLGTTGLGLFETYEEFEEGNACNSLLGGVLDGLLYEQTAANGTRMNQTYAVLLQEEVLPPDGGQSDQGVADQDIVDLCEVDPASPRLVVDGLLGASAAALLFSFKGRVLPYAEYKRAVARQEEVDRRRLELDSLMNELSDRKRELANQAEDLYRREQELKRRERKWLESNEKTQGDKN